MNISQIKKKSVSRTKNGGGRWCDKSVKEVNERRKKEWQKRVKYFIYESWVKNGYCGSFSLSGSHQMH